MPNEITSRRFWLSTAVVSVLGLSVRHPNVVLFMAGWQASEFAHLWVAAQAANLVYLFNQGEDGKDSLLSSSHWVKLGLVLNLLAMRAGAQNLYEGFQSRDAFATALRQAQIEPKAGSTFAKTLPGALLSLVPLLALTRRGKDVRIDRNIPYADIAQVDPAMLQKWKSVPPVLRPALEIARGRISQWMTLNVFYLGGTDAKQQGAAAPVLTSFHGGGWAMADKWVSAHALFQRIASRGVVVCIINYRMSPEAPWPVHIQDCKRGLLYVKKHCQKWGGDPNNVFISGESAGGHLCALAALTPHVREFQPEEDMEGDTSVRGALPLYGVMDFTNATGSSEIMMLFTSRVLFQKQVSHETLAGEFSMASPLYHVRRLLNDPAASEEAKALPPFFSVHGTKDALAPYEGYELFVQEFKRLREQTGEKNKGDVFVTLEEAHHALGFMPSIRTDALADAMTDFIYHHCTGARVAKL